MTGQQILNIVRAEIRDSGSTKLTDVNALIAINKGLRAVNEELILWEADETIGTNTNLTITASVDYVDLPVNFKVQKFLFLERYQGSSWVQVGTLVPMTEYQMEYWKNATAAQPGDYRIKGTKVYLRPIPDANYPYRIVLYYYQKLTELTALSETVPLNGDVDDVLVEYLKFWSMLTLEKATGIDSSLQALVKIRVFNIISLKKPYFIEGGSLLQTANWDI